MIKVEKIRRNNVTNTWEHWLEGTGGHTGYWAEGLTGLTVRMKDVVTDFSNRNFNGELLVYEDAVNEKYAVKVKIVGVDKEAEQKIEKDISELIDNAEIGKLTPVILKNLSEIYGEEIKLLNDIPKKFRIKAANPNPFTDLDYFWFFDTDQLNNDSEDVLRASFPDEIDAPLKCQIVNPSGEVDSDNVTLKIIDPTQNDFFGRNLVKNSDASEGLKYWETISGNPQVVPIWRDPVRYGYFNSSNFTVNPPQLDSSLTGRWGDLNYFHAGSAEDDNIIAQIVQEIDLSGIEEYIDREIEGISALTARLYGWLGAFGYLGGGVGELYRPNIWGEGWYYPSRLRTWDGTKFIWQNSYATTHDQVAIFVDCLDKNGVVLITHRIDVEDTNHIQKVSLKSVVFNIPKGTRTATVRVVFEKDRTNGLFWFRRYWEDYNSLSFDHLTMATHIGFMIDVNGRTDPYLDKFDSDGRFIGEIVFNEDPTDPEPVLGAYPGRPQPNPVPGDPILPSADFSADIQSGEVYLTVEFTSHATDSWGHFWDFGDGYTSTETNPVHTYKRVGNYTVTLTTQDAEQEHQNKISKQSFIRTTLPSEEPTSRPHITTAQREVMTTTATTPSAS